MQQYTAAIIQDAQELKVLDVFNIAVDDPDQTQISFAGLAPALPDPVTGRVVQAGVCEIFEGATKIDQNVAADESHFNKYPYSEIGVTIPGRWQFFSDGLPVQDPPGTPQPKWTHRLLAIKLSTAPGGPMSIKEKLETLGEKALDSLYTGEVQALIFGLGWGIVSRVLDVPRTFDLQPITSLLPAEWAGAMPTHLTPGFFVIVSILLIVGKGITPGKLPFVSNRTTSTTEEPKDA